MSVFVGGTVTATINHLQVSMACATLTDKHLCDFSLWERDLSFNRRVIDATVALSIGSRLHMGVTDRQVSLDRYQSMLLEELIVSCPMVDADGWKTRMLCILDGTQSYQFRDVAQLVNAFVRYSDDFNMEQLMLTGLLFRVFDFRTPDISCPTMKRINWWIIDMHKRAMITNNKAHVLGDMKQDPLNYKSDVKRCFTYVASMLRTADHLDNWSADAVTIGNALFLECGLGYISRTSPYRSIHGLIGQMWPQQTMILQEVW